MELFYGAALSASIAVAVYAMLTLPRWLFSSLNRGSLWRLRDEVFDARRTGALPFDSPSVTQLLERLETAILVLPEVTALQVNWLRDRLPDGHLMNDEVPFLDPSDLDAGARATFLRFQNRFGGLILRQLMTGSWSGLVLFLPKHARLFRHRVTPRDHQDTKHGSITPNQAPRVGPAGPKGRAHQHDDLVADEEQIIRDVERAIPHMTRPASRRRKDLVAATG